MTTRTCRNCGDNFTPATCGQDCCSSDCRVSLRTFSGLHTPGFNQPRDRLHAVVETQHALDTGAIGDDLTDDER